MEHKDIFLFFVHTVYRIINLQRICNDLCETDHVTTSVRLVDLSVCTEL